MYWAPEAEITGKVVIDRDEVLIRKDSAGMPALEATESDPLKLLIPGKSSETILARWPLTGRSMVTFEPTVAPVASNSCRINVVPEPDAPKKPTPVSKELVTSYRHRQGSQRG